MNVTGAVSGQEVRALPEGFRKSHRASFALRTKLSFAKQNGD